MWVSLKKTQPRRYNFWQLTGDVLLKQRLLTAAIGIPLLLYAVIWAPSWVFSFVFIIAAGISTFELTFMLVPKLDLLLGGHAKNAKVTAKTNAVVCAVFTVLFAIFYAYTSLSSFVRLLSFGIPLMIALAVFSDSVIDVGVGRVFAYLAGLTNGLFPWIAILELQRMAPGAGYLILLLTVVWMGDTGGYFGGRYLGGKFYSGKLAPSISPKKTWEGALSGLTASFASAFIVNAIYGGDLGSPFLIGCIGLSGGTTGQIGDLVESAFKRFSGVKDSGSLIPGHGGFLDRIDGLLLAGPVVFLLLTFF